jgi:leucyl aminopeptidase
VKFAVSTQSVFSSQEDANVIAVFEEKSGDSTTARLAKELKKGPEGEALANELEIISSRGAFTGSAGKIYRTHVLEEEVVFIGLGKKSGLTMEKLRRTASSLQALSASEKYESIAICLKSFEKALKPSEITQAVTEGMILKAYRWGKYKTEEDKSHDISSVHFYSGNTKSKTETRSFELGAKLGEAFATGTNVSRDFSNEPPNVLTPAHWAKLCQDLGKKYGFSVKVLDMAAIKKEKMGTLLAVNQGSHNEPRVVVMKLKPKAGGLGRGRGKKVTLVGKGLTFDSGGISLKPSPKMDEMKHDKSGGCTVLGAMVTMAMIGVKNNVTVAIGMTDNMPGSKAAVPSDIFTSRSGLTVDYVQDENPDVVVDVATLTGAVSISLGEIAAGIMGNDKKAIGAIEKAAEVTSEPVWELPLLKEYVNGYRCYTADFQNIGSPGAGSQKGAIFLQQFIREKQKWVHVDIAAVAWGQNHIPYAPKKGATGACTRALAQFCMDWN